MELDEQQSTAAASETDDRVVVERVTDDGILRYCRECRTLRPVRIKPSDDDNYYQEDISMVVCAQCEAVLAHLTWWPDEG